MSEPNRPVQYHHYSPGGWEVVNASAIVERSVSLTVNGEVWLSFMCTPADLEHLAVGFLFNEGLINRREEIAAVHVCNTGDNVDVWLTHSLKKPDDWRRTSGCVGGQTAVDTGIELDHASVARLTRRIGNPPFRPDLHDGFVLTPTQALDLVAQLFESQTLYRQSGGVHTSALADCNQVLLAAEDIGRHNTLDKLAGRCLLEGVNAQQRIILTTGRISSEMLQKAARLGAAVVISRTAPSSMAVQLAESWGLTLIGYARRDRFNVYAHPQRIASFSLTESAPLPQKTSLSYEAA